MRKHISFAIAATMLGLAIGFWTITGVAETIERSSPPHSQAEG
jgi:hypothetical protein